MLNIVRVELFDATAEDYESFHAEMEDLGFVRTMTYPDRSVHRLPTGTYSSTAPIADMGGIRDQIVRAGQPYSSKNPAVFVGQVTRWGSNLYKS